MLPGKTYTPEDIIRLARRRKWLILLPFAAGIAASVGAAGQVQALYRSETLIMVVPQRISDTYVKSADTTRIEDRLPSISEQIQSRSRLERIINEFDLYREARATGVMEDVVARMRSNIVVKLEGRTQEAFRISYVSDDARTAQRVTERLASWYIEENLRDRESLAASTNEFLAAELEDAKRRLVEHEQKLEDYRRRYSGELPTQLDANIQSIQNAHLQLQTIGDSINRARERRLLIERQLADAQLLPAATLPGAPADAVPLTAAQQLEGAEALLARARLRLTPEHPDIRAAERTIKELKARAEAEANQPVAPASAIVSPSEALRQKRINDYKAEIEIIDRQIVAGQADQDRLHKQLVDLQAKVDAVPTRESELVELTRDYATLQASYTSLLQKRQDSQLATNLERRQIGEQFKVLDPASLPERPMNEKTRLMVLAGGSLGGLGLGLLIVVFLEYRDSSFKTEADVMRVLTLPVLALVPLMVSAREQQRERRRRRMWAGLVVAVLAFGSVAAVAFWRLQPWGL